jgi:uncharacterized membrane protein YgdD (TMEM256/DUF423 family)
VILFIGAILGFVSVAFGAFSEHGLREAISSEQFRFLMTAVRYNQVHAVTIVVIGLFLQFNYNCINASQLKWSAIFFIIGTTLFSFSIYLSVWLKITSILIMTPFGGIIIIVGWLTLGAAGIKTLQLFNNKLRP